MSLVFNPRNLRKICYYHRNFSEDFQNDFSNIYIKVYKQQRRGREVEIQPKGGCGRQTFLFCGLCACSVLHNDKHLLKYRKSLQETKMDALGSFTLFILEYQPPAKLAEIQLLQLEKHNYRRYKIELQLAHCH